MIAKRAQHGGELVEIIPQLFVGHPSVHRVQVLLHLEARACRDRARLGRRGRDIQAVRDAHPDAYAEIERRAARLASILETSLGDRVTVTRVGTLVGIHLGPALAGRAPTNFTEAKTTDEAGYARFFHAALTNGVAMAPGAYEAMFVGLGHDDVVLDELERRLVAAAESVATGSSAS